MDVQRVRGVPLFAELSDRDARQVARWLDEVQVSADDFLVNEGAFAHEFFVILDGTARVVKGDQPLTDLGPGDFFGEMALLDEERRTATVQASSPMTLGVMFARDFRQMEDSMPTVAARIREAIAERMQR